MLTSLKREGFTSEQISSYVSYLSSFAKSYPSSEELVMRARIFFEKDKIINEWNMSEDGVDMQLGHNRFSDWTQDELNRIKNGDFMKT